VSQASLTIVGMGIKFVSHLTVETKAYIEQSQKVLYLVNDPAMKSWLEKANPNAVSLDNLYSKYLLRQDCYQAITDYILEQVRLKQHVCVVIYGHPAVLSQSAVQSVITAREEGFDAIILPAVSAEDCLFADLHIDPGAGGCYSCEATDFLIHDKQADNSSHLILWQVGGIGNLTRTTEAFDHKRGIKELMRVLQQSYPESHSVCIYQAAQYATMQPRSQWIELKDLMTAEYTALSTLYVPPAHKKPCNQAMLQRLGMES
jgi:uncharacterized protein YabN with tetrapyrrole methylase and pyrophosphatase domain